MKTLAEIRERFVRSAMRNGEAGRHVMERNNYETAGVIDEVVRRDEDRATTNTELEGRIAALKDSLAFNSRLAQEAEAKAARLIAANHSLANRDAFLSNQNSCLRDEVRMLRDEIKVNRGRNECLMKELDEVAPFKWEYTPDGTGGGGLKYRKSYIPLTPADFSQIEGRLARTVAARGWTLGASPPKRRSKFEVGQLVNVVRGGFYLHRVKIVSVIYFTPEAPNGILGSNAPVDGEELGVKYLVRYNTIPGAYVDREVWAWMLELAK